MEQEADPSAREADYSAIAKQLKEGHRALSDHLWSLTMESGLTADFFAETLASSAANLEATRSIDRELSSLKASAADISVSAAKAEAGLSDAAVSSRASLEAIESGAAALRMMDERFTGFLAMFQKLSDSVDGIGGTIRAIDEISELTNLLSLNAAIEAARAGVHGKGFKVVANEVKSLAEKSRDLTAKASGLLKELKDVMSSATSGLDALAKGKADLSVRMAASKDEQARGTVSMTSAADHMKDISGTLRGQTSSSEHIAESMSKLALAADSLTENSELIQGNLIQQKRSAAEVLRSGGRIKVTINELSRLAGTGIKGGACDESISIGHDVTYPPWVYIGEGHSAGITIEVARQFAKSERLLPEFKPSQFGDALEDLFAGGIDVLANVGWPNAFFDGKPVVPTTPLATFRPAIFSRAADGASLRTLKDLDGKRVAVQRGSYVVDCLKGLGCEVVTAENDLEAFAAVIWQRVDCAITERLVGSFLSKRYFSGKLAPCFETGHSLSVVFLLRKEDAALRDRFDAYLGEQGTKALVESQIYKYR